MMRFISVEDAVKLLEYAGNIVIIDSDSVNYARDGVTGSLKIPSNKLIVRRYINDKIQHQPTVHEHWKIARYT